MSAQSDGLYDLLKRIAALKRAPKTRRGRYHAYRSPYKPVLLLSVLRRIQQGREPYASNRVSFGACEADFRKLYAQLFGEPEEVETKVTQAFWYLGSGSPRLWGFSPKPGMDEALLTLINDHAQIKTPGKLKKLVEFASFSAPDWSLVTDSDVQEALISFLIAEHFADVRREIGRL